MFIKRKIPFPLIDIYLFQWNKLKPTGIHDHAEKGCYIWLLKGVLKEDIYNKHLRRIKSRVYKSPSISFMNNDIGYHCVQPLQKSISLHFYYPKGHKTKYYNIPKNGS